MKEIPLTKGNVALVDDEDYAELSRYRWHFGCGYAIRNSPTENQKKKTVRMHTEILGKVDGLEVDHINGNGLDNRRENLRHATRAQNQHNQTQRVGASSRYKGVYWYKTTRKWSAQIAVNGHGKSIGYYTSERDAALAYNEAARKYFGEYARLNVFAD
jgi:hypothetical protein